MTHYEQCCARECEWCAKELPFSAAEGHHWTGNLDAPRCTAPTLAQFAERCAEALEGMILRYRGVFDTYVRPTYHETSNPDDDLNLDLTDARRALGLEN